MSKLINILPGIGKVFIPAMLCIISMSVHGTGVPAVDPGSKKNLHEKNQPGLQADSKIITGKITGDNNKPLSGASVFEKGTNNGTTTDENGNFTLTVPNNEAILVISYTGYAAQEIPVKNKTVINISLKAGNLTLDEVVVGYGSQRKSDLTGSLSSVRGSDLNKLPTQRVDQALQGRAAGVMVQNTDGAPGGNATIRIRGGNSITGSNNALIVVDGLQGVNISTLNPNDIESLEVLKDASATAIYGARGANGVILITTKKRGDR